MITLGQAGKILNISAQWLRELGKRGYVPVAVDGKLPMDRVIQDYLAWLKRSNGHVGKNTAAIKLQTLRAKEIELRIAQRLSELIPTKDFSASIEIIYDIMHSEMKNLPSLVTSKPVLQQQIKIELDEIFKRTRERIEEAYQSYQYKPI
jgi:hypothetical protein